jgi:hypothetical protein
MPIAIAANILCKEIVHKALQALAFVFSTPIAMPSKIEWKHNANINKMVSPNELAVGRVDFAEARSVPLCIFQGTIPSRKYISKSNYSYKEFVHSQAHKIVSIN